MSSEYIRIGKRQSISCNLSLSKISRREEWEVTSLFRSKITGCNLLEHRLCYLPGLFSRRMRWCVYFARV